MEDKSLFVIEPPKGGIRKIVLTAISLYFIIYSGYFAFSEAAAGQYKTVFFMSVTGFIIALFLFLSYTLWLSIKDLIVIGEVTIESNVPKNKLKIEWVKVSKISIGDDFIVFYTDGERKKKELDVSQLPYRKVIQMKKYLEDMCNEKCIPLE